MDGIAMEPRGGRVERKLVVEATINVETYV
jgi:hypothetical protein